MIQDSGNRREFDTGAVRDIASGKGRFDLTPLDVLGSLVAYMDDSETGVHLSNFLWAMNDYVRKGDVHDLETATDKLIDIGIEHGDWTNYPDAFIKLSQHFENGCVKYGERNWEKGIPISCYVDSAVRHLTKALRGDTDEPHMIASLWNLVCLAWTHSKFTGDKNIMDLPFCKEGE